MLGSAARRGADADRARESAARRVEVRSLEQAHQLDAQYERASAAARSTVRVVHQAAWWAGARAEEIADVYMAAVSWRFDDQEVADAHAVMDVELSDRYGIRPERLAPDWAAMTSPDW